MQHMGPLVLWQKSEFGLFSSLQATGKNRQEGETSCSIVWPRLGVTFILGSVLGLLVLADDKCQKIFPFIPPFPGQVVVGFKFLPTGRGKANIPKWLELACVFNSYCFRFY